jgi:hypothetical protein
MELEALNQITGILLYRHNNPLLYEIKSNFTCMKKKSIIIIPAFIVSMAYCYEMPLDERLKLLSYGVTEEYIKDIVAVRNVDEDETIQRLLHQYHETKNVINIQRISEETNLEARKGLPIYLKILKLEHVDARIQALENIIARYKSHEISTITSELLKLQVTSRNTEAVAVAKCIGSMGRYGNNDEITDALLAKIRNSNLPAVIAANIDALNDIGSDRSDVLTVMSDYLRDVSTPSNVSYSAYRALGRNGKFQKSFDSKTKYRGVEGYSMLQSISANNTLLEGLVLKEIEDLVSLNNLRPYEILMLLDIFRSNPDYGKVYAFTEFVILNMRNDDGYISSSSEEAFRDIKIYGHKTISLVIANLIDTQNRDHMHAYHAALRVVSPRDFTAAHSSLLCAGFLQVKNKIEDLDFILWVNLLRHSGSKNELIVSFFRSLLDVSDSYYSNKHENLASQTQSLALLTLADFGEVRDQDVLVIADLITNSRSSKGVVAGIRAYSLLSYDIRIKNENLRLLKRPLLPEFRDSPVNLSMFPMMPMKGCTHFTARAETIRLLSEIGVKHLSEFKHILEKLVKFGKERPHQVKDYIKQVDALLEKL